MLVACLPFLVALLVGLPSTVTAQTLDHQQLDISGALGTNPASLAEFGGKHLSKHPAHSVEDPSKVDKLRIPNHINLDHVISQEHGISVGRYDLSAHHLKSVIPGQVQKSFNLPNKSKNMTKSSLPCPEPTDIAPCVCSISGTSTLTLDCSDVESFDQLAAVFMQDFPFKTFYEFRIFNNNNLQYLTDIFNGVTFRFIDLRNMMSFSKITTYAFFESTDTLENIYISGSALDENSFPFSTLDQFTKLESLAIDSSNIGHWPAFDSSSIRTVSFQYNHVSTLPADTFAGLLSVNRWDGYTNAITVLEAGTFKLKSGSNYIGIWRNSLHTVEPGAFVLPANGIVPSLGLDLSFNSLTTLDEAVYGDVFPFVSYFYIEENPLDCGCDIAWIITNPDYVGKIAESEPTCRDGTLLRDLDPQIYTDMCFL